MIGVYIRFFPMYTQYSEEVYARIVLVILLILIKNKKIIIIKER